MMPDMRVGLGYDIHPLAEDRPLILGGIAIAHHKGLAGHSDADALIHAICDALLGALGEGDIGSRFPSHDPAFKDISSAVLLEDVQKLVTMKGYTIVNLDAVIIAQAPRLGPYLRQSEPGLRPSSGCPSSVSTSRSNRGKESTGSDGKRPSAHTPSASLRQRTRFIRYPERSHVPHDPTGFSKRIPTGSGCCEQSGGSTDVRGVSCILAHRIAHWLLTHRVPLLPRILSHIARMLTGVEIHPAATIGSHFVIDHGSGVVIGETTIIGDHVTLFQGVTLGGTGKERGKRHPTLGSHVIVGAGAKILGGMTIGDNVIIGANSVVLKSVPPHSTVIGVPARVIRVKGKRLPEASMDHINIRDPLSDRLEAMENELRALRHERRTMDQQGRSP